MNEYFPLVGLGTFMAVAWTMLKYSDHQRRLREREEAEERRRKEVEAARQLRH